MVITYPLKSGLYVNLTNRCPCACVFCLRQNSPGVFGTDSLWLEREPTVEEIVASVDSRNLGDFEELVFCGYGEPTERLDDLLAVKTAHHCIPAPEGVEVHTEDRRIQEAVLMGVPYRA